MTFYSFYSLYNIENNNNHSVYISHTIYYYSFDKCTLIRRCAIYYVHYTYATVLQHVYNIVNNMFVTTLFTERGL